MIEIGFTVLLRRFVFQCAKSRVLFRKYRTDIFNVFAGEQMILEEEEITISSESPSRQDHKLVEDSEGYICSDREDNSHYSVGIHLEGRT